MGDDAGSPAVRRELAADHFPAARMAAGNLVCL